MEVSQRVQNPELRNESQILGSIAEGIPNSGVPLPRRATTADNKEL